MEPYIIITWLLILAILGSVFVRNNKFRVILSANKYIEFSSYKKAYQNISLIIGTMLLFLIAILRDDSVGVDYGTYMGMFRALLSMDASDISSFYLLQQGEFAIPLLGAIAQVLFNNEYAISALLYFLILGGVYLFISEHSKDKLLSIYLFITMSFYNMSFNIMRQYLAAAFVLIAIRYIGKNFKKFALLLIVAVGFHKTAFLMFIIYVMVKAKMEVHIACVMTIIISALLGLLGGDILPIITEGSSYGIYVEDAESGNVDFKLLINGVVFLVFFLSATNFVREDENAKIWVLSSALTLGLNIFALNLHLMNRLMLYFMLVEIVSIPNYICLIKNNKLRCLCKLIVVVFSGLYYCLLVSKTSCYGTVPYILGPFF